MKEAFTLIELLVVVLIIGILAAVAVPQYQKAVAKSQASLALAMVKEVYDAQKVYYLANGEYASNFEQLDIQIRGTPAGERKIKLDNGWTIEMVYDVLHDSGSSVKITNGPLKEYLFELYTWRHYSWPKINRYYCASPKDETLCKDWFYGTKDGSFGNYEYYYLDKIVQ